MTELDRLRAAYPPLADAPPPQPTIDRLAELYDTAPVRRRAPRGSRRTAVAVAIVLALAGTALAATVGGWHPVLGSPGHGPPPRPAGAPVPAAELRLLGVLRRPQTAADRGPIVAAALRDLTRYSINGIHTDAIRVLARGSRSVVILVPAERVGPVRGADDVLCVMSGGYEPGYTVASGTKRIRIQAGYSFGYACGGIQTLRTTGIAAGLPVKATDFVISGPMNKVVQRRVTLVPDGVASVRVRLRGGHWITARVRDNIYTYLLRGAPANLGTIWFDAHGRRVARPWRQPIT